MARKRGPLSAAHKAKISAALKKKGGTAVDSMGARGRRQSTIGVSGRKGKPTVAAKRKGGRKSGDPQLRAAARKEFLATKADIIRSRSQSNYGHPLDPSKVGPMSGHLGAKGLRRQMSGYVRQVEREAKRGAAVRRATIERAAKINRGDIRRTSGRRRRRLP